MKYFLILFLLIPNIVFSATFTDESSSAHAITAMGDTYVDSSNKKFGAGSGNFDGNGDYLDIANHNDFYFSTGDFTIEAWVYLTDSSSYRAIAGGEAWESGSWTFDITATDRYLRFNWFSGEIISTGQISLNTWTHVAVTRSNANGRGYLFIGGVESAGSPTTLSGVVDVGLATTDLHIGDRGVGTYFQGNIDEIRISKGLARWTSNFTPSSTEYENDANTHLLIHANDIPITTAAAAVYPFISDASSIGKQFINGGIIN